MGWGASARRGGGRKAPSLESLSSLGFRWGSLGCPRKFSGMSQTLGGCSKIRRVKSTLDLDTFEKYRDTPPILFEILLPEHALLLAESSISTTNLPHDTAPICIAMLSQKY